MIEQKLGGLSTLGVVLLVAASLWVVVDRFQITTDIQLFLPPGNTAIERLLLSQLERGATTNLVFASIEGADPEILSRINKKVAAKLRQSDLIQRVFNGEEGLSEQEQALIFNYRYLLSSNDPEKQFSVEGLRRSLSQRLRGLASSTGSLEKKYLRNDPTAEFMGLMGDWLGQGRGAQTRINLHGVWFSKDKKRSLLVIETHITGFDIAGHGKGVEFVSQIFNELRPEGIKLTLTGPSVFAVETRDHLRDDVKLLSVLAVVFVGLFLLMAFRSLLLLFYLLIPLGFGVLVAVATVLLVFGNIHGITLAFGITLTGVAVDYPIHLFSHLDGDRSELRKQVRRIWPTLRLGVITTVIAYTAFVLSDFDGLRQLGLFTVSGLITAAITTRWLLPSIVPTKVPLKQGIMRVHGWFERFGRAAPQLRIWASLVVILAAAYLVLTEQSLKDYNVDSLSPIPVDRRMEDRQIRNDLGMWYGGKLMIVVAPSAETALQRSESLVEQLDQRVKEGAISGYQMAAQYLPSIKKQKQRVRALPNAEQLQSRLNTAVDELPFKQGLFDPFIEDVQQTKSKTLLDIAKVKEFNVGARLAPLLSEGEMGWTAPILLNDVTDPSRFTVMTGKLGDVETYYLDLKGESTKIVAGAIDRVIRLLGWGGLFIYMVLAFNFKSPYIPLRILGPTLASVLVVSALLVSSGTSLNLFHLVSLLLVIGLGLDYALFFNRLTRHHDEWATTYKALWVCCITTVLVFGMLMLSHASPLQAIGKTVASGAALCLAFGAIWSGAERRNGTSGRWRAAMNKHYIRRRSRPATR